MAAPQLLKVGWVRMCRGVLKVMDVAVLCCPVQQDVVLVQRGFPISVVTVNGWHELLESHCYRCKHCSVRRGGSVQVGEHACGNQNYYVADITSLFGQLIL
jgi:hypothetical protein